MVTNLLLQPLLLLPFCSLWATPQEALLEAPFCNPFYFVFAVSAGWEVALGWKCLVSDAGWFVLDCRTALVLVLEVPHFGCCLVGA